MSVYPDNIGKKINKKNFSEIEIKKLKISLPKNLIIRVYGLAGVGKGTLSSMLANTLEIPNLESSLILRCATYIYSQLNLDLNKENTDLVFEKMKIVIKDNLLVFFMENKELGRGDLKNDFIDQNVNKYSGDLYVREKFDQTLDDLVQRVFNSPCVADGRGSHEPYLINAEKHGFKVIRILLDADQKVKAERYYESYIQNLPNAEKKKTDKMKVLNEFQKSILKRDEKDIKNILDKKIGLISDDTGIIDTSHSTPQEVLETALSFVWQELA